MKPVLFIQNEDSAPPGIIGEELAGRGVPYRIVHAWTREELPSLDDVSGVVTLGGVMNADQIDQYPFLRSVRELTREAAEREVPYLGVCLGSQILARALDAPVQRLPKGEVGFCPIELTPAGRQDPVVGSFAAALRVFQWHEDGFGLPDGAELLASGSACPYQAFRYGDRAYAIQFHFEVTRELIAEWCRLAGEALESVWGITEEEMLAQADAYLGTQERAAREAVARFVDLLSRPTVDRATKIADRRQSSNDFNSSATTDWSAGK